MKTLIRMIFDCMMLIGDYGGIYFQDDSVDKQLAAMQAAYDLLDKSYNRVYKFVSF